MSQATLDPYATCPCGSGKKVKFCCGSLADEMVRVRVLQESGQARASRQALEQLYRKHHDNHWVTNSYVNMLFEAEEFVEARSLLELAMPRQADNDIGHIMWATAILFEEGYSAASKHIQKAFQRSHRKHAGHCARLALNIMTVEKLSTRNTLMMREHVALALRWVEPQGRDELFRLLLSIDGDLEVPYPLRSANPAPELPESLAGDKDLQTAAKYAYIGCFGAAADTVANKTAALSQYGEVWHTLGLYRVWSGDLPRAIEALHMAATQYGPEQTELAIECETLAQLLEPLTAARTSRSLMRGRVAGLSINEINARLADWNRIVAERDPQQANEVWYSLADRPMVAIEAWANTPTHELPLQVGWLRLEVDEETDVAYIALACSPDAVQAIQADLATQLATTIEWLPLDINLPGQLYSADMRGYVRDLLAPRGLPAHLERHAVRRLWSDVITPLWRDAPQSSLAGQSPRQAAANKTHQVALRATLNVFDALADVDNVVLDRDALAAELNLPPTNYETVDIDASIQNLSVLHLQRLNLESLTDVQLKTVAQRATVVRELRLQERTFRVVARRDTAKMQLDPLKMFRDLAIMARDRGDVPQALSDIQQLREHPMWGETPALQRRFSCDLAELTVRLDQPEAPDFEAWWLNFRASYQAKFPDVLEQVNVYLRAAKLDHLVSNLVLPESASSAAGGLWTPGQAQAPATGGKLWIPGN